MGHTILRYHVNKSFHFLKQCETSNSHSYLNSFPFKCGSIHYTSIQVEALSSTYTCNTVDTLTTSQTLQQDMLFDHHHVRKTFDTCNLSFTWTIDSGIIDGSRGGASTLNQEQPHRETPHIYPKSYAIWYMNPLTYEMLNVHFPNNMELPTYTCIST